MNMHEFLNGGKPTGWDHNSYWCDHCEKLWPIEYVEDTSKQLPNKILHMMHLISAQSRWPNLDDAQAIIDLVKKETVE